MRRESRGPAAPAKKPRLLSTLRAHSRRASWQACDGLPGHAFVA